jgi:hypothetical protein
MNKLLFFLFITLVSTYANANLNNCVRTQSQIRSLLALASSRVAFKNAGGLINGGVCWWHSRLQRSSAYLVHFEPHKLPPTPLELRKILHSLRVMDQIVFIPGYSDFASFSKDYGNEIQQMLNDWQKRDGFFNFEWIRGISGRHSLSAADMRKRMDAVYLQYKKSPTPLWIMAQIKGVTSHSFLVLRMNKNAHGYDMTVIDSNYPLKNISIIYHEGDNALRAQGAKYTFVPYVGFQNDFRKISLALKKDCGNEGFVMPVEGILDGEIERY